MSLLFRSVPRGEQRASGNWPTQLIPSRWSAAGISVNAQNAQGVVGFSTSAALLTSIVSMLPIDHYTHADGTARPMRLPLLLTDPGGEGYGLQDWLAAAMLSGAYRGNMVGLIAERDPNAIPTTIILQDVDKCKPVRDSTGSVRWHIGEGDFPSRDVWHLRRYPVAQKIMGLSPIEQYANTLGLALGAEQFGSQWFADGATPSSILTSDQSISQFEAKTIKDRFMAAVQGNREPAVLGAGVKYTQIQVSAEESQFLATQQWTASQCARILGPGLPELLGYNTGDSMTYKNRESVAIDLLTYTVDPWLTMLENSLSALLFKPRFVKFNRAAILRTDIVQRYTAYRTALGPAEPWATANEVRALEDELPVPWGDEKPTTPTTPGAPVVDPPVNPPKPGV